MLVFLKNFHFFKRISRFFEFVLNMCGWHISLLFVNGMAWRSGAYIYLPWQSEACTWESVTTTKTTTTNSEISQRAKQQQKYCTSRRRGTHTEANKYKYYGKWNNENYMIFYSAVFSRFIRSPLISILLFSFSFFFLLRNTHVCAVRAWLPRMPAVFHFPFMVKCSL